MKIGVVAVPYFLTSRHVEWAKQTMDSVTSTHDLLRIASVNRVRNEADKRWLSGAFDYVEMNDKNILARAWNRGITHAVSNGCEFVLVINLDLIFHPACIDNLIRYGVENPNRLLWSGTMWNNLSTLRSATLDSGVDSHVQWSCFMIRKALVDSVGLFDEQFEPAYLEDCDMKYRLKLRDHPEVNVRAALFFHLERGTMKGIFDGEASEITDHIEVLNDIQSGMESSAKKYEAKWGGLPQQEKYSTPYNRNS